MFDRRQLCALAAFGAIAWATSSEAAVILTLENPTSTIVQQTNDHPCVIGDPSCNNPAGFGFTTLPSGGGSQTYDTSSPDYTVQQVRDQVGDIFAVGIDVNSTEKPTATEQLDLFEVLINGVQQFVFDPASPGPNLIAPNNGTGFSDDLLLGFDLSSFLPTDIVSFHIIVNDATDGREEFFLIPQSEVPEPTTLAILGAALIGLGAASRLRRRTN